MPKDSNSKTSKTSKTSETVELEYEEVETKVLKEKEPVPENSQEDIAENKSEFETYEEVAKARKDELLKIKQSYARLAFLEKEADRFHAKTAKEVKKKNKRVNSDPNKKPAGFETPVLIPEKFFKFITNGLKKGKFSEEKTKELEEKNLQEDSMIPRSIVTRMVYDYIKHLNLYEETADQNKRFIKPDDAIKTLFSMSIVPVRRNKDGLVVKVGEILAKEQVESKDDSVTDELEPIGFFNFQTFVCRLFPKVDKSVKNSNKVDDEEEEVENLADQEVDEEEESEEVVEPEPVKKKSSKSKSVTSSV
jgi:hypothetical protein